MTTKVLFFILFASMSVVGYGQVVSNDERDIMQVLTEYSAAMGPMKVEERDKIRERLLTENYFYMGIDGMPVSKKAVMVRQVKNKLQIDEVKVSDFKLHIYPMSAIATMRYTNRGTDMGKPFASSNGHVVVLTKTKDGWRIAADVVGRPVVDPKI